MYLNDLALKVKASYLKVSDILFKMNISLTEISYTLQMFTEMWAGDTYTHILISPVR